MSQLQPLIFKNRVGSPVIRVSDPEEADLFYVPFFSSLSLIVNTARPAGSSSGPDQARVMYSDEENQEALVEWLEEQEYWKRNNGRDHVIVAQDPNALYRVIDKIKNSVLLVSDFGRLRSDQASLIKDVIVPYSHRINTYTGDVGVGNRKTLLFFMGARYRKEGGKIRDLLFQLLENEEDVIVRHGTQSRENRRAASQGMHTSKFCLNPAGDTPSACRLFDSIVSLCVPVIISDSIELPFEDVIDYRKIAIFIDSTSALKPGFVVSMLRGLTTLRIMEYQRELKEVKHYFQYEEPNGTVNEIWRQVSQKLPLIKLMINREKRLVKRELTEPDCSCLCTNQTGILTSKAPTHGMFPSHMLVHCKTLCLRHGKDVLRTLKPHRNHFWCVQRQTPWLSWENILPRVRTRKPRKECLSRATPTKPESMATHASWPLNVYFLFWFFLIFTVYGDETVTIRRAILFLSPPSH